MADAAEGLFGAIGIGTGSRAAAPRSADPSAAL